MIRLADTREDYSADGLRGVADAIRFATGTNPAIEKPTNESHEDVAGIAAGTTEAAELVFEIVDTKVETPISCADIHRERFMAALNAANASVVEVAKRMVGRELDPLKGPKFHPGR